jgi:hypothetical protein
MIIAVPADAIAGLWPGISVGIERCLAKGIGRVSIDEIYQRTTAGEWLLFLVMESDELQAVFICSIYQGDKRIFEIGMAWGKGFESWGDEINEAFTTIAEQMGCDSITLTGRQGWAKVLEQYGYKQKMITMQKVLTNG